METQIAGIQEGRFSEVCCPTDGCSRKILDWAIKAVLKAEDFDKFQAILLDKAIKEDNNIFRCPNPGMYLYNVEVNEQDCKMIMEKVKNDKAFVDANKLVLSFCL